MTRKYRSVNTPSGWEVQNQYGYALYTSDSGGVPMSQAEAGDLAWAWNNHAYDDGHAMRLILQRYRDVSIEKRPDWLIDYMIAFDIENARAAFQGNKLNRPFSSFRASREQS